FLDADVAKFDESPVTQKTDVAGWPGEAGVTSQHRLLFDDAKVGIENNHAVQRHLDPAAIGEDFLLVPLAHRFAIAGAGGNNIVDGAVILFGPDLAFVHLVAIVENLNLHALVGGVALKRRANADAVICARGQHKLEAKSKI